MAPPCPFPLPYRQTLIHLQQNTQRLSPQDRQKQGERRADGAVRYSLRQQTRSRNPGRSLKPNKRSVGAGPSLRPPAPGSSQPQAAPSRGLLGREGASSAGSPNLPACRRVETRSESNGSWTRFGHRLARDRAPSYAESAPFSSSSSTPLISRPLWLYGSLGAISPLVSVTGR